ncbi:hypothetical protein BASA81_008738 [Batrachochytrium salamandrivorans]|nr:hypothetical protein BASA81_008738 [Batrachochytrium salamandrivorans]
MNNVCRTIKTRFSVVDCARMASEVNSLLSGSWVQNIYTTEDDAKTFLFKLTGRGDKYLLLLESGVRFHPTEFVRDKSEMPSGFAMKLRKHVRGRRLEYCRQVGLDRVVDFAFGKGAQHHHVVLEMYAGGNVILTNEEGVILTLLRPYTSEEAEGTRVAVGKKYPFDLALEGPRALLLANNSSSDGDEVNSAKQVHIFLQEFLSNQAAAMALLEEDQQPSAASSAPEAKKKGPSTVKQDKIAPPPPQKKKAKKKGVAQDKQDWLYVLASKGSPFQSFGPQMIEHCLLTGGFDLASTVSADAEICERVATAMMLAPQTLTLLQEDKPLPGFVYCTKDKFYEGFEPLPFVSLAPPELVLDFPSFYQAVDDFYSKTEQQKLEKQRVQAERANQAKIDNVRKQQQDRVSQLQQAVEDRERQARILQHNVELVDQAIGAVLSLQENKMSWKDVEDVVKQEKRSGNPVASIISSLNLKEGKITVALVDDYDEDDDEEEEQVKSKKKPVLIEVELQYTAQANVALMFSDKKKASVKAQITQERASLAVEDMQTKLQLATKKKAEKSQSSIRQVRKPFWFEKFHWFLTSEGVLVLGGRDAHQNELLFKRFLRKGDAYLHADFHGATTCIVRNPFPGQASAQSIPVDSMRQAGVFCICHSQAWQAKLITSAWWVEASQVSRTAPSGEYLSTGSFMIRGKKNYLQPPKLEMGFGYIFKLDLTVVEDGEGEEGKNGRDKEWRYLKGLVPAPTASAATATVDDDGKHEIVTLAAAKPLRQPKSAAALAVAQAAPTRPAAVEKPKSTEPSRKAKLKMKRTAAKYADQSEEERRLAMIALGHKMDDGNEDGDVNVEDEEEEDVMEAGSDKPQQQEGETWLTKNKVDRPEYVPKTPAEIAAAAQPDEEESEAVEEDGPNVVFNGFTAAPQPGDVLLYALPFCGPVEAMVNFKFKVKLTPGTLKKGKAAKQAVSLFIANKTASTREKQVISSITDPENVAMMMMDVKVSAPGIEKLRADVKSTKKKTATAALQAKPVAET